MSTKDLVAVIGKTATYSINGLDIRVKVVDVKKSYGLTDYLITPLKGTGEAWVRENIKLDN